MQNSARSTPGDATPARSDDIAQARAALAKIDFFRSERAEVVNITRLGGLTNCVFKVDCNGDSYVLRLAGEGTSDYIDRAFEATALRETSRANVSPELIHCNAETGDAVTVWARAMPMTTPLFRANPGAPRRAGEVLRRLHVSGAKFDFQFDLFGMIDEYLGVLARHPTQLPHGLTDMLALAEDLRQALARQRIPSVACHCDLLPDNFLDTGTRMYLVDWEFSGMNDPMWDLGDAIVECGFSPKEERELIAAYFGGDPSPAEMGRIVIYKAMCDLLWTLWGLIQHANGNPADDFRAYAAKRFSRAQAVVRDREFARHRAAIDSP